MMINKLLPKSPLVIALTTAAVILAVSPEARRFTRKMAVKGMGAIMGMAEGMKGLTSGVTQQISGFISEGKPQDHHQETEPSVLFNADIQSEAYVNGQSMPYNVMNDQAINQKLQSSFE